jgi:ABC-2 type transport system permease protein
MNWRGVSAIYRLEMARWMRTPGQSLVSPVLTTSLYFIVFGAAIGGRIGDVAGPPYGAVIVPGLVMVTILTESVSNASFGIFMPKWSGTIYELLLGPVSSFEAVLGHVGAAATRSVLIGVVILATARLFVPHEIAHPLAAAGLLVSTAVSFCLFGLFWAFGRMAGRNSQPRRSWCSRR